ncbi:YkyB family protein [Clostridium botulinum]
MVSKCKQRQEDLYELKNKVMDKMIDNDLLIFKGYHIQQINEYENYLLLYTHNDYSFHIIEDKKYINFNKVKCLGKINDIISAERTKKVSAKFNEAVRLLNKYLE